MKKLILACIAFIAISNVYVGCSPESLNQHDEIQEIQSIEKEEIKDDDI